MASISHDFPFRIMDVVQLLHLKVRRCQVNSAYIDCPFCNDYRGKMNVNYAKNAWRCNYCGELGGMLALYARMNNTTTSDAYREICDALQTGEYYDPGVSSETIRSGTSCGSSRSSAAKNETAGEPPMVPQSEKATPQQVHQTLSLLFEMLSLRQVHRAHLKSRKRGLTEEQIQRFGFKSTPPYFLCRSLTERLIKQGCTVQGVPGFYMDKNGNWTVSFSDYTSGILIPAVGIDGLIHGAQILLDKPMKNKDDPPDKPGAKYVWFSSSNKHMGTGSGSPLLFLGDLSANTVYITEGLLKAYISHALMHRTIAATAGANNTAAFDELFKCMAQNGTKLIIEAQDMDKYANDNTAKGASKIYLLARKYGMECRRLTWNPNFKELDDWQLSLKYGEEEKPKQRTPFKEAFLWGECSFENIYRYLEEYNSPDSDIADLHAFLGLTEDETEVFCTQGDTALQKRLACQQRRQQFRIYQLNFDGKQKTIPFAYKGFQDMVKAGYSQPPAGSYRKVYEGSMVCPCIAINDTVLRKIRSRFGTELPEGYPGKPVDPSDVLELYDEQGRSYFYVDTEGFKQVRFSPFLAKSL